MKIKFIVIISLIAIVLLAATVLFFANLSPLMFFFLIQEPIHERFFANPVSLDESLIKEAVAKKDYTICRKVSKEHTVIFVSNLPDRLKCYREVLSAIGDSDLCSNSEIIKNVGNTGCYYLMAIITNDARLCSKITTTLSLNGCYYELATTNKDPKICDNITQGNERGSATDLINECYYMSAR